MPVTPHSSATHLQENQILAWPTVNSAINRLDQSAHGLLEKALTSADYTLTSDATSIPAGTGEAERASYIRISGVFAGDRTITLPNNNDDADGPRPKHYIVEHAGTGGFELTITTVSGTGVTLTQGNTQAVYVDGTNVVPVGQPTGAGGVPYDAIAFIAGLPGAGALVLMHRFSRPVTFVEDVPYARAYCLTPATGATSFDVKRQIPGGALTTPGTVDFAIGANEGTFTWAADVTYNAGDVMLIYADSVQDATLADIAITLSGLRL